TTPEAGMSESELIVDLLKNSRNIAVVGLSSSPMRPSYGVAAYMQSQGYKIIPINPQIPGALGEKAYPSLSAAPSKIDIVTIFRRPEFVPAVVEEAIKIKPRAIRMQEGVMHEQAAARARDAGIFVMQDRCILKEHRAHML